MTSGTLILSAVVFAGAIPYIIGIVRGVRMMIKSARALRKIREHMKEAEEVYDRKMGEWVEWYPDDYDPHRDGVYGTRHGANPIVGAGERLAKSTMLYGDAPKGSKQERKN